MYWLTVGLLLGEPGSKLVHVLISLLSNQVKKMNPGFLGGWVNGAKVFLVFPLGVLLEVKKIYMYFVTQSS